MGDDRATGRLLFKIRVLLRARGGVDGEDTASARFHFDDEARQEAELTGGPSLTAAQG